jgi:hypothetical protein
VPLIDLRLLFNSASDYANPIEPSPTGGTKLVEQMLAVAETHDFAKRRTWVYCVLRSRVARLRQLRYGHRANESQSSKSEFGLKSQESGGGMGGDPGTNRLISR